MSPLHGLLALALLGAEAPKDPDAPGITYETWMVEMESLDWRATIGHDLHPVSRQGGATVWTAPHAVVKPMLDKAAAKPSGRPIRVPRVTSAAQAVATISMENRQKLATRLSRHADGPVDRASAVAYLPEFEEVREGFRVTMSGRKIDQGVLAKLVAEDTRLAAVHKVPVCETVSGKGHPDAAGPCRLQAAVEVPELVQGSVAGEWLIPNDGVLVVSLGTHTTAGPGGKAEVHERVLFVEAWAAAPTDATIARASLTPGFSYKLPARPTAPAAVAPEAIPMPWRPAAMPRPAMPSRSLPQPLAADGSPVTLPPLPDLPHPPSSLPGTSDPCASPQTPLRKDKDQETKEPPKQDPQSKPVRYDGPDEACESPCCMAGDLACDALKCVGTSPSREKVLRIPTGRGEMIEITVRTLFRNVGVGTTDDAPATR